MKTFAIAALALLATSAGCGLPPFGVFYTGTKGVQRGTVIEASDGVRPGPKQGKACASGVLGLAAWGDMSLDSAKKAAGITRVDTLDFSSMRILFGVYVKNCTIITGE
jgi:hypothetical protein